MPTVFITGATKNTGFAIAERFAGEGFDVAISSRNRENAEAAASKIRRKYKVTAKGYAMDLLSVESIQGVFAHIKDDFGRLDTFVANSADLGIGIDILTATEDQYDDLMNTNVKGNYFACREAAMIMKEQGGGSIVIIGSVHCKSCVGGRSLYSISKGALSTLVRSMAVELGMYNIRANCLLAGAIRTDRWDGISEEEEARRRANWPLGLESDGEDIANGAFYLGSSLSKTVTGTDLVIDSGILASLLPYKRGDSK